MLWIGTPHALVNEIAAGSAVAVLSPSILAEIAEALGRPKFGPRLASLGTSAVDTAASVAALSEVISEPEIEPVVQSDPDDDKVVACAVAARADFIVSGDRHLRSLDTHRGIRIVSPRQVLDELRRASS